MQNYKLTLCYDGTKYKGWQRQGNTDNTIQAKLEALLSRLLGSPVEVSGSGRTDAGVHAYCQVCSFRASTEMSEEELLSALRRYLPEDIGAVSLTKAAPDFHARLSCREKSYLYRIWNSDLPNVFSRRYTYTFPDALNISEMRRAAALMLGKHDFTSFCANKHMKKSAVRELRSIEIYEHDKELRILLTGDGFLYNMVRIIVGTLIEVGTGTRSADSIPDILRAKDRSQAGFTAPAQGLALYEVKY